MVKTKNRLFKKDKILFFQGVSGENGEMCTRFSYSQHIEASTKQKP